MVQCLLSHLVLLSLWERIKVRAQRIRHSVALTLALSQWERESQRIIHLYSLR